MSSPSSSEPAWRGRGVGPPDSKYDETELEAVETESASASGSDDDVEAIEPDRANTGGSAAAAFHAGSASALTVTRPRYLSN